MSTFIYILKNPVDNLKNLKPKNIVLSFVIFSFKEIVIKDVHSEINRFKALSTAYLIIAFNSLYFKNCS